MKKVLIVDDEKSLRNVLKDKLSQEDYTLLEAADGIECMKILETEPIDLVLLDIMMPNMNGIEVAKQIHESDAMKKMPQVIVLTNKGDMETIADVVSTHKCKYLVKSDSTLEEIIDTVKATLEE